MSRAGVVGQIVLAAAGLLLAYLTWQRRPDLAVGESIVVDLAKSDLQLIRFADEERKSWVELTREPGHDGPFVAVKVSGTKVEGGALPPGHPTIQMNVPDRQARGSANAKRVFEAFAPLKASRALGVLDDKALKELGLDATKKTIEVRASGVSRRFKIAPAPPGGNDPYLRDERDGKVYVVSRSILSDLQSASVNLIERKLHDFRIEDADRLAVTRGARKKEFVLSRVPNAIGVRFAPAAAPDKFDETVKNWHERIWKLFPSEVLGKDEPIAPPRDGQPGLRLEYSARGSRLGWLDLIPGSPQGEQSTAAPAGEQYPYARSEFTLGWFKLPAADMALLSEVDSILGGK